MGCRLPGTPRDYMVGAAQQEIRSPDFLPEFRESANFMRLSLKENRTRGHLSAPRSCKSGRVLSLVHLAGDALHQIRGRETRRHDSYPLLGAGTAPLKPKKA